MEWDCFDKFDLLTPLMTFDPDEKKIHMYTGKVHCSHLNWEILLSLVLEIKIQEVFKLKTGNDPLMTFDLLFVTITCAPTQAKSHDLYLNSSLAIHTKYEFLNILRLWPEMTP